MNLPEHSLSNVTGPQREAGRRWLMLGVTALGAAGIFAGMLANTKSAYFYTALVAHVDLSVLVWFLSFACLLMTLGMPAKPAWGILGKAGFMACALGALGIAASAFAHGTPFQNNYIPVIYHPLFFVGLSLLFCGVLCVVIRLMLAHQDARRVSPVAAGIVSIAALLLMAAFCFLWSYRAMPRDIHGQDYYEQLFWAGGHVLQIAYAQLMIIAWLWLAESAGLHKPFGRRTVLACYAVSVVSGLAGVAISLLYPPATLQHRDAFTALMRNVNGLPALIIGIGLTLALIKSWRGMPLPKTSLAMSIMLFTVGGALGYLIHGSNETVPAHYHGSIVGVTLALMGLAYILLPELGFRGVYNSKLARLQPVLYGGGQLCWMFGMAIGGAEGVGRKIPGSADVIGGVGGFLKHMGDGLSLIGGLLFVWVVLKAMSAGNKAKKEM